MKAIVNETAQTPKFMFYSMHDIDIYILLYWLDPKSLFNVTSIPFASTFFLELDLTDQCQETEDCY